jgi:hypothetical protein
MKGQKEKKVGGYSLFAVGKYQIVPYTLKSAVDRIQKCDTSEPYGPEQQEAFGAYLALMKRPKLGKYLLGDKTITAEEAQLEVAKEWAGVRVLGNHYRPDMQLAGLRKGTQLVKGNSYYKDFDNWSRGRDPNINGGKIGPNNPPPRKDTNPDDAKPNKADATAKAIEPLQS